jgi:Phosphoesterase family
LIQVIVAASAQTSAGPDDHAVKTPGLRRWREELARHHGTVTPFGDDPPKWRGLVTTARNSLNVAFMSAMVAVALTSSGVGRAEAASSIPGVASPDHVVIVIEENHAYSEIVGSSSAPYINSLANQGAVFTQSFAVTHPSEPNYLALFSGSTQLVIDDSCPHTFSGANLASGLIGAGLTFGGYSEGLPAVGSTVCTSGAYARKHNPWVNFTNVPSSANLPLTSFSMAFATLPTISIVIPNLNDDMHDGTIAQGDSWLQSHLDPYFQWAKTHNSMLIVTWDEDDSSGLNQIPTIFVGSMVKTGHFSETINHYNVLRTLQDLYSLPVTGSSGQAAPIADVWKPAATPTSTPSPTVTPTATRTSTATATSTPTAVGPVIVTLSSAFNVNAAYADGAAFPSNGGIDGVGSAYSSTRLGASLTWSGTPFQFGQANQPNGVRNAMVTLPAGRFTTLRLLGTGVNGDQASQTVKVTYTDGTSSTFTQTFSNWRNASQNVAGQQIAVTMAYRNKWTGVADNRAFNLYGYSFGLTGTKTISSLMLPSNQNVTILAATLVP